MVTEGAHAIQGAASFIANKAPESAGKAAGFLANTTEKAVGATKDALHGGVDKLKGVSKKFKASFDNARTPKDTANIVEHVGSGNMEVVEEVSDVKLSGEIPADTKEEVDVSKDKGGGTKDAPPESSEPSVDGNAKEGEGRNEKKDKTQERFDTNFKSELAQARSAAAQELQKNHPDLEITIGPDGLPIDPKFAKEYAEIYVKHSEVARNQAIHTTITQDFMDDNPIPDKDKDPVGYDKYMQEMNQAHQEFEQAKKDMEKPPESTKAESGSEIPSDADATEFDEGKEKEDNSASFANAFKLAAALEKAEGDEAIKLVQNKIDQIHNANETVKPRFKSRVTIAKVLVIGKSLAFMSVVGAATGAAEKVASASSK